MYKTIRHGENSLQYTILPQNDDFRIEGKLSSAGSQSTSGKSRKTKTKPATRRRRRSFFAYLGLIFVCTVIVGAILIPFLVSAECLPNPTEWFLKTKAAFSGGKTESSHLATTKSTATADNVAAAGRVSGNGINVGKIIKIISKDGNTKALLMNRNNATASVTTATVVAATAESTTSVNITSNLTNLNETQSKFTAGNDVAHEGNYPMNAAAASTFAAAEVATVATLPSIVLASQPTVAAAPPPPQLSAIVPTIQAIVTDSSSNNNELPQIVAQPQQVAATTIMRSTAASNVNAPHLPPAANNMLSQDIAAPAVAGPAAPAMPTIMTRIIQVPLLKSAAKKPIMPPVLAKTNSQYTLGSINNADGAAIATIDSTVGKSISTTSSTSSTTSSNWIHSHWPYIDPSTYFQWTGYKAEDSVLLPALLGFALIGIILIITVCLVARNKRTIVSSVRKRNRNDIEEAGAEDNTTLLTTTNLSDED